ncbi:MAG: hypothetical protein U0Q16_29070 [Bryobacteraceae bacterium]
MVNLGSLTVRSWSSTDVHGRKPRVRWSAEALERIRDSMGASTGGFLLGTLDERQQEPSASVVRVTPFPGEIRRATAVSVRDWRYLNEQVRRLSGAGLIGIYRLTTAAENLAENETDQKILEKYAPMGAKVAIVIESAECAISTPAPESSSDPETDAAGVSAFASSAPIAPGIPGALVNEEPASKGPGIGIWLAAAAALLLAGAAAYNLNSSAVPSRRPQAVTPTAPVAPALEQPVVPATPSPASQPTQAPVRQAAAPQPGNRQAPKPRAATLPEPKAAVAPNVSAPPQLPTAAPVAAVPSQATTAPPVQQPDRRGEALKALERDTKRQEALKALEAGAAEKSKRDAALRALGQK